MQFTMAANNRGVCHGCRRNDHLFKDCPNKWLCPWFKHAFVKYFVVAKETNKREICSIVVA